VTSPLTDALVAQQDRLLACVHCGFCLPVCPTYTRLGDEADSPRGRLYLMRSVVEGRLDPAANAFQLHIDRCLGCRACETICPSGVEYGALLEVARAEAAAVRTIPWPTRAMLRVFESGLLTGLVMALAMALRASGLPAFLARVLPGWRRLRSLRLAAGMLAATTPWRRRSAGRSGEIPDGPPTTPAGYRAPRTTPMTSPDPSSGSSVAGVLEGCVQQGLFSRVNAATGRTLEVNGLQVAPVPGQGCCGALHAHAGDIEGARELARRNVDAFTAADVGVVVVNAAGCGAAMKEYAHLLAGDPDYAERARALAARVRDVAEVLAERGPLVGASVPVAATYDAPCHLLHAQRVARAPRAVLAAVPDFALRPLEGEEECCGGAGIYGITHPELGGRIGTDKADAVRRTGAELLVTGNPGCAMQIGAWLSMTGHPVPIAHPVEVLDESYRRAGYYSR
jgi:glycolate oxidase iron-sulfur subunit